MWTWYVARATGLVALVLLTGTLVLGVSGVVRWATAAWPRFALGRLHRNMSLLAVVFLVVHVVTVIADGYVDVGWLSAVVPFVSDYQPFWVGLGVAASDLVLALVVTSLLRARIGLRAWRAVHWAAYAAWPLAVAHGLGVGTDSTTGWVLAVTIACIAVALGATIWRAVSTAPERVQAPVVPVPR